MQRVYLILQATTEEIVGWLQDLNEDDDAEIIENINNANFIDVTLLPTEEQELSDCDDADEDDEGTLGDLGRGVLKRACEIRTDNSEVEEQQFLNEASSSLAPRTRTSTQRKTKKRKICRKWSKIVLKASECSITAIREHTPDIVADILENYISPIQLFKRIFDSEFMECIQSETVKYAINKGDEAFTVSLEELYTYFGILILSGYNKVPAISMYWQTESDVYNHLVTNRWSRILVSILSSSLYEENQFAMDTKFGV
ncbi:piggyBac transposable element-derived protein 2-like isoform X2 [Bactrocera neohumeralis]|uniref:piggyBac transposable element-derived protein 2-like isoform X2 n=1 Tax=Bactrocera neohumeralis TaxID=98809 RepID=UPI00216550AF|nr:piggyBac transposable element-derived protein 2-like isoform X2 [Bactrocera neohumeralis]